MIRRREDNFLDKQQKEIEKVNEEWRIREFKKTLKKFRKQILKSFKITKLKGGKVMNRAEWGMVDYLKTYCYGREHALRKDSLAAVLGMTTRHLRRIKRKIVVEYGWPIGSDGNGYFYAKDKDEIEICKNYYLSLIQEHLEVIKSYENMISHEGQLKINIGVQDESK